MTKLKQRKQDKQTAKEYVTENFINKGYVPVLNKDNTYSWVDKNGNAYSNPNEGGLAVEKQHELIGRRFDNQISKYVMNYLKSKNNIGAPTLSDKWDPSNIKIQNNDRITTSAGRTAITLAEKKRSNNLFETLSRNDFKTDEERSINDLPPEINNIDWSTATPEQLAAAHRRNIKGSEGTTETDLEKTKEKIKKKEEAIPKDADYILKGIPLKQEFYRKYYFETVPGMYKSETGFKNWYQNLNKDPMELAKLGLDANKLNVGTPNYLPPGDITESNWSTPKSIGFYKEFFQVPKNRELYNIGDDSTKWEETIKQFSPAAIKLLNNAVFDATKYSLNLGYIPQRVPTVGEAMVKASGMGFKKGGKLVIKAQQGVKYKANPESDADYFIGKTGRFVKPLIDAANIFTQKRLIDRTARERNAIPVRQHAYFQRSIRPVEGVPQEVLDEENNQINRIRPTIQSSDQGINLAANLASAFERDSAREKLTAKNAETIYRNKLVHDKEAAVNDEMNQKAEEANMGEIYKKNVNDVSTNIWKTQQYRRLASSALSQLGLNYVNRSNFAYKNMMVERNTNLNNLLSRRAFLQQLHAQDEYNTETIKQLKAVNDEISKQISTLPSFNTVADAGLSGKIDIH